jgi:hypothetical protein
MTLEIQFLSWDRHKNANNDIIPNLYVYLFLAISHL